MGVISYQTEKSECEKNTQKELKPTWKHETKAGQAMFSSPFSKTKKQTRKPNKKVVPGKTTDMLFEDIKDFIPNLIMDALNAFNRQSCVPLEVPQVELPHSFGVKVPSNRNPKRMKGGGSQNL